MQGRIPAEIHLASLAPSSSPAAPLQSLAAASSVCGSVKIALIYAGLTDKRMKKNSAMSVIKRLYCDDFEGAIGANDRGPKCRVTAPHL